MAFQYGTFSTDANAERERIFFRDRTHPFDMTFDDG